MILDSYDGRAAFFFFLTFLRYKIDHDGARQINIARASAVRPEYINRVYKGRQTCSVEVQEKICRFFGISYLEALAIGRHLVETGETPAVRIAQPDDSPPPAAVQNRRMADDVSEADVVAIVSQWAVRKKRTEDSLAKLQNLIENLGDGVVILDANLTIEYQNRAHREMFGASLVGQACWTAHGGLDTSCCLGLASKQTGMPASGIIPCAKGAVSALTTPIRSISGQIESYVAVFRDVTESEKIRLLAEESLRMIDRAVLVCDENHKIVFFNAKLREITGASEQDLVSTGTFLRYLRENEIYSNVDAVVEMEEKARKEKDETSITILFRSQNTYLYTTKPIYSGDRYIGRISIYTPIA